MEILEIIAAVGMIVAIQVGFSFFLRGTRAVGKTVFGKGSISENMSLEFKGMGAMEIRCSDSETDEGSKFIKIECKGLIPVRERKRVGFIISVFDTDENDDFIPVLSMMDSFQEDYSSVYQHSTELGMVEPDRGFVSWVQIGVVIPEIIQPPYGGLRSLRIIARLVDLDDLPIIENGFGGQDEAGLLWVGRQEYRHFFENKGYMEETQNRDEARGLAIGIGVSVAMADGSLDDEEGIVLSEWIKKIIAPFSDDKRERLKELYNDSLRNYYQDAESGSLVLSDLCTRLADIGEQVQKYEALDLAHDVMAADGVMHEEEMKIIKQVADFLDLDSAEIEKMRDHKIIQLDPSNTDINIDGMLGIDPDWDSETINGHLRAEFRKWNNRLNTLPEGEERDNAQNMLDMIAQARESHSE